jgi:uncharacterized protein
MSEERAVKYLVTDADGKGHLPYTKDDGKPDHRLMGAAWAALHGGYRGNKYSGPNKDEAITKLKRLYKSEGMDVPKEGKSFEPESECRFFPAEDVTAELRIEKRDGKASLITGYPAKFNKLSRNLGGFRERILPGAFTRTLAENADVRGLINHNPDLILGRTAAGTMRLKEDTTGLNMEIDAPDTQIARDLMVSIDRGDINQGSFRFRVRTDNWKNEDGDTVRELQDVDLMDASVVTFPAYEDTSAQVRSIVGIFGTDGDRVLSLLVRAEHDLPITAEDRELIGMAISRLEQVRAMAQAPFITTIEMAKRRLAFAERGL